jgi:hypothetical protein
MNSKRSVVVAAAAAAAVGGVVDSIPGVEATAVVPPTRIAGATKTRMRPQTSKNIRRIMMTSQIGNGVAGRRAEVALAVHWSTGIEPRSVVRGTI